MTFLETVAYAADGASAPADAVWQQVIFSKLLTNPEWHVALFGFCFQLIDLRYQSRKAPTIEPEGIEELEKGVVASSPPSSPIANRIKLILSHSYE